MARVELGSLCALHRYLITTNLSCRVRHFYPAWNEPDKNTNEYFDVSHLFFVVTEWLVLLADIESDWVEVWKSCAMKTVFCVNLYVPAFVALWLTGNIVGCINEVTLHKLVLYWDGWQSLEGWGNRSGTMSWRCPGSFFWVLPKRSITKPDQHRKDFVQEQSLGADMLQELKNSKYTRYHIELINRFCGGWLVSTQS